MTNDRIDPAALLLATLAVVLGPLTTEGAWHPINTLIAVIAATAVLAYSADRRAPQRPSETWAFAFVLGLILAVLIAWPAQQAIARLVDYDTGSTDDAAQLGLDTLNWVVVPAAVLFAIAIGAALRYRTSHTNTKFGRPSSNRPRP